MINRTLLFFIAITLAGCDPIYPLVANGYSKAANITTWDKEGGGGYLHYLLPQQCLEVMHEHPIISAIKVIPDNQPAKIYNTNDIILALNTATQHEGVFVVDEKGLQFVKNYQCYHPKNSVRQNLN